MDEQKMITSKLWMLDGSSGFEKAELHGGKRGSARQQMQIRDLVQHSTATERGSKQLDQVDGLTNV